MAKKISIITRKCKRCDAVVSGVDRPINYSKRLYDQLAGICERCIKPEEKGQLENPDNLVMFGGN